MTKSGLKVAIMFFSATGNCKRIAEKIAAYFGETAALADITHCLNEKDSATDKRYGTGGYLDYNYDILFVIVPVYSQMSPEPVIRFLKRLHFTGKVVPCVSFGSVSAGRALRQIGKIFQKKGSIILAGAEFASYHFYTPLEDSDSVIGGEVVDDLLFKENLAVEELCSKVVSRLDSGVNIKKIPIKHFNPLSLVMPKLRAQIGIKIRYTASKCIKCQVCMSICPFNAINKDLKINRKCLRCGRCLLNCKNNKHFILHKFMRSYLKRNIDYSVSSVIY